MKKILIAIDEGPTSEKVAEAGKQLGKELNAELALLSVVNTEFLVTDGGVTPQEMAQLIKNDYAEKQKMLAESVFKGTKIWTFVEQGNPYEIILKVADEWGADIIVLGTHGRTGLKHLLMGSIAEKVTRHSTKPLYIVPSKML